MHKSSEKDIGALYMSNETRNVPKRGLNKMLDCANHIDRTRTREMEREKEWKIPRNIENVPCHTMNLPNELINNTVFSFFLCSVNSMVSVFLFAVLPRYLLGFRSPTRQYVFHTHFRPCNEICLPLVAHHASVFVRSLWPIVHLLTVFHIHLHGNLSFS